MMKLYVNPGSGSACVEAALAELELPFERIKVEYSSEEGVADDSFAEINPRMQIPALILEDGTCLTETAAILMHLADTHPASGLAPASGTLERARLNQWMCFTLSNIYEGELRKNYPHRYVSGDPDAVEEAAEAFVMSNYKLLEEAMGDGPYFGGETCTIFDLYLWMFVNWFEEFDDFRSACPKIVGLAETVMLRPKVAPIHEYNFGPGLGWGGQL
ncbi:MAG: glutathione S-transferase family protein [Pseudomonadota bacterium]